MVAISKVCFKMRRPVLIKDFLCPCDDNCMRIILYTYATQKWVFQLIKKLNQLIILITSASVINEEVIW